MWPSSQSRSYRTSVSSYLCLTSTFANNEIGKTTTATTKFMNSGGVGQGEKTNVLFLFFLFFFCVQKHSLQMS